MTIYTVDHTFLKFKDVPESDPKANSIVGILDLTQLFRPQAQFRFITPFSQVAVQDSVCSILEAMRFVTRSFPTTVC